VILARRLAIALIVGALAWALLVRWGLIGDQRGPVALRSRVSPFRLPVIGERKRTLALNELRGRGVLINFWATWCEPCIDELPLLKKLQQRYSGLHFTIVGVTDDDLGEVESFLSRTPLPWPVLHDARGKLRGRFAADVLPYSVYIGPDGRVAGAVAGVITEPEASAAIERLVSQARIHQSGPSTPPPE
jgi:thiol-disulfide isomerase/thioredoxin